MTDRLDLESRLRDSLVDAAADAPGSIGLAAAARRRARVRRRRRAAGVVVAAGLAVVPLALFLDPDPDRGTGPVVDDNQASEELNIPNGWRVESFRDLQILVPSTWEYGSLATWCARGDGDVPGRPVVERPGEDTPAVDCSSPEEGYGVQLRSADGFQGTGEPGVAEEVVAGPAGETTGDAHPIGAWVGHADVDAAAVAYVVAPSEYVASYLLESARRIDGSDANGCAPRLAEAEAATTDAGDGQLTVCHYGTDEWLEWSGRLTSDDSDRALADLRAAPLREDAGESCAADDAERVVLIQDGYLATLVTNSACAGGNGVYLSGVVHEATDELLRWVRGP